MILRAKSPQGLKIGTHFFFVSIDSVAESLQCTEVLFPGRIFQRVQGHFTGGWSRGSPEDFWNV